jgi:polar amino acid transport system substrate-binding protein
MDNFANSYFYTGTSKKIIKYDGNKGHKREIEHFFNVINGKEALNIPFNSQFFTTLTTFKIIESLSSGKAVDI